MCGLVGMAGNIDKDDRALQQDLLLVDVIRGPHSTGVATANDACELSVFKKAICPSDFIQMQGYANTVQYDSQVIIGHNRFATVGRVNNITAHPFEQGDLIGAHNGTLRNWYNLPKAKDFDVDSECLIYNIAEHGWEKTMPNVEGAFALTTYDAYEHQLKIMRNDERPLWIAEKADGSVLYWASEIWMLRGLAGRHGIKLKKNIWQPKEHVLHSWQMPNVKSGKLGKLITKELKPIEKKYQAPILPRYSGQQTGGSRYTTVRSTYQSETQITLAKELGAKQFDKIDFVPCSVRNSTATGRSFLEGCMVDEPWSDVRVYMDTQDAEDICERGDTIEAQVSCLIQSGYDGNTPIDAYILCREDSISIEARVTQLVQGPGNKMVTVAAFNHLTKDGCALCTTDLDPVETYWVKEDAFCEKCNDSYNKRGVK